MAVDAALPNRLSCEDIIKLTYGNSPYCQFDLDSLSFVMMVLRIAGLIGAGEIVVPGDAKSKFKHFYSYVPEPEV